MRIDLKKDIGRWISLGTFPCSKGKAAYRYRQQSGQRQRSGRRREMDLRTRLTTCPSSFPRKRESRRLNRGCLFQNRIPAFAGMTGRTGRARNGYLSQGLRHHGGSRFNPVRVSVRRRDTTRIADATAGGSVTKWQPFAFEQNWPAKDTIIIICDMWNKHGRGGPPSVSPPWPVDGMRWSRPPETSGLRLSTRLPRRWTSTKTRLPGGGFRKRPGSPCQTGRSARQPASAGGRFDCGSDTARNPGRRRGRANIPPSRSTRRATASGQRPGNLELHAGERHQTAPHHGRAREHVYFEPPVCHRSDGPDARRPGRPSATSRTPCTTPPCRRTSAMTKAPVLSSIISKSKLCPDDHERTTPEAAPPIRWPDGLDGKE